MKTIDRRAAIRTLVVTVGAAAVGRGIFACSEGADPFERGPRTSPPTSVPPNDQDEHVPGESTPVNAGDEPPTVPNQVWEARVKQLEAEQERQYGRGVFLRGDAGVMSGKENSHEPRPVIVVDANGKKKLEVKVEHVMGKNGLDAGVYDAGQDAARVDAGDAGNAGDAGDAGDGGRPDAGDAGPPAEAAAPLVHFITTVYLRAVVNGVDTVVGLWEFVSTDAAPPTVRFTLPLGVTSVTAYEWCTLHGLWKAPAIIV